MKKSKAEADWKKSVLETAARGGIQAVANITQTRFTEAKNISLNESISVSAEASGAASLAPLESDNQFRKAMMSAELNQVIGPIEAAGNIYFISVTAREIPDIPDADYIMKNDIEKEKYLSKDNAEIRTVADELKRNNLNLNEQNMYLLEREKIKIVRYGKANMTTNLPQQ